MTSNSSVDEFSIYNTKYQPTFKSLLAFELKSLYGRLFFPKKPNLKKDGKNYLHLGCGSTKLEGWVNADFFAGYKFWKKYDNTPDWMLDLRFPLKCDDNVWDGVFSEHTLEHLHSFEVFNLLKELKRTMKPGAWIRITVPDLRKYVNYYCGQQVNEEFLRWTSGCEAIGSLTQNYGHQSVWDSELLKQVLKEVGFINIKEVSFRQGTDELLFIEREDRQWETLYMEAQKPSI
ncbi:MAG: methyltransferase domain-containing protein [Hydrococcus sp. Prado102]|jgi:predicted SAM-dependent methyltransferase|nr:methyltransferase domain-containing protein [Hydrococcus sp. Prado102]